MSLENKIELECIGLKLVRKQEARSKASRILKKLSADYLRVRAISSISAFIYLYYNFFKMLSLPSSEQVKYQAYSIFFVPIGAVIAIAPEIINEISSSYELFKYMGEDARFRRDYPANAQEFLKGRLPESPVYCDAVNLDLMNFYLNCGDSFQESSQVLNAYELITPERKHLGRNLLREFLEDFICEFDHEHPEDIDTARFSLSPEKRKFYLSLIVNYDLSGKEIFYAVDSYLKVSLPIKENIDLLKGLVEDLRLLCFNSKNLGKKTRGDVKNASLGYLAKIKDKLENYGEKMPVLKSILNDRSKFDLWVANCGKSESDSLYIIPGQELCDEINESLSAKLPVEEHKAFLYNAIDKIGISCLNSSSLNKGQRKKFKAVAKDLLSQIRAKLVDYGQDVSHLDLIIQDANRFDTWVNGYQAQ